MKLEVASLKRTDSLTEKWVQSQIGEDPSILGLGDLILKDKERIQPSAGRLDLLLQDPESLKRYEVEIQLGATDESHIIRTIEYWDVERGDHGHGRGPAVRRGEPDDDAPNPADTGGSRP